MDEPRTRSGIPTDAELDALAGEAETGYDVSALPPGGQITGWRDDDTGSLVSDGIAVTVSLDPDRACDEGAEERASMLARMAVARVRRARSIAACSGHEWEHEFAADYLDGGLDVLCRCGARRSEVERAALVAAVDDAQATFSVPETPGYWPNETSGVLVPAVEKYLAGEELDALELAAMRAYVRQWINHPGFLGPDVRRLRAAVDEIQSREHLRLWLASALDAGIDPL